MGKGKIERDEADFDRWWEKKKDKIKTIPSLKYLSLKNKNLKGWRLGGLVS